MKHNLRGYQRGIITETLHYLFVEGHRYVIVVSPTGSGKTLCLATLALWLSNAYPDIEIVIMSPRKEVCEQIRNTVKLLDLDSTGVFVCTRQGAIKHIQRTTKQVYLIIDEAHHAIASTITPLFTARNVLGIVGFTATPKPVPISLKCLETGVITHVPNAFTAMVHGPLMSTLIKQGYLAMPEFHTVSVQDSLNFVSKKQKTKEGETLIVDSGDLGAMYRMNNKAAKYRNVVEAYSYVCGLKGVTLKALCFGITRKHCETLCVYFLKAGYRALFLHCGSTAKEREYGVSLFRNGEIDVLLCVDLFGEGFDAPDCDAIIQARPTNSLTLFMQQVGRALRIATHKTNGIILDVAGNLDRNMNGLLTDLHYDLEGNIKGIGVIARPLEKPITLPGAITKGHKRKPKFSEKDAVIVGVKELAIEVAEDTRGIDLCEKVSKEWVSDNQEKKLPYKALIQGLTFLAKHGGLPSDVKCCLTKFAQANNYKEAWVYYKMKALSENNGDILQLIRIINETTKEYARAQNTLTVRY